MFGEAISIFRAEYMRAIRTGTSAHLSEQREILLDVPCAVRAISPSFGQRAAVVSRFIGRKAVDIGEPVTDKLLGELIERLEIVGREKHPVAPFETEPADILLDRLDILQSLFRGVGIVKPEVAGTVESGGDAEVQAD